MKELYFVRHGESLWNVEDKICGATDSPLTEKGRAQAEATGKVILGSGIRADLILYSPLLRAADTALKISAMTGIPAKMEPRLIEQNFGTLTRYTARALMAIPCWLYLGRRLVKEM